MKNYFRLFAIIALFAFASCADDNTTGGYETKSVSVQLVYPGGVETAADVPVNLTDANGSTYVDSTDAEGLAAFKVPTGVYEASASDSRADEGTAYIYNGSLSNIDVNSSWDESAALDLGLTASEAGQIVIKELYIGGCPKDDGSGSYYFDSYVVLYNNSTLPASLDNVCLGMVRPYSSTAINQDYVDGKLFYEAEGWIPAGQGFWYFQDGATIQPGEQLVVALKGAIDHTISYSNSVNLANENNYCTYDIESGFNNTKYYPSPAAVIPTSHYLKAYEYGQGNAWAISNSSPAFFVFNTKDSSPESFGTDDSNLNYHGGSVTPVQARKKVPVEWILDGVEVFNQGNDVNTKRLTAAVDAGSIYLTNKLGYALYRDVDKEATEALPENEGKLVYGYAGGTNINGTESTDPSGIDAEASMAAGARIIYQDTNNSTNDFHQRAVASIKE
ncbi:MAG: DUF4876 domain-containing protein [Mangrovibacterium sp.]